MFTSLADLVGRKAPVQWFEGVAIVQALGKQLLEPVAGGRGGVPDYERIVLTSDGEVVVAGGAGGGNTVAELGRLLTTLVPAEGMPAPLRVVATNATAAPPVYAELADLVRALSYFERPNLQDPIRDVYERWLQLPPEEEPRPRKTAAKPPAPTANDVVAAQSAGLEADIARETPPAHPGNPGHADDHAPWSRRLVLASLVGVALVGLGLPAWWAWHQPPPAPVVRREPPPLIFAAAPAATAEGTPAPAESPIAALPPGAPQKAGGAAPRRLPEKPPVSSFRPPASGFRRLASGFRPPASDSQPAASGFQPAASDFRRAGSARTAAPSVPLSPASAAGPAAFDNAAEDSTIYSSEALDVTPPVPVRRMQRSAPAAGRAQELPIVEVIVSAGGDAEAVRLLKPSDDVYTLGMVSVVKAWRFHPAMKNGRPVRYRYRVQLTGR